DLSLLRPPSASPTPKNLVLSLVPIPYNPPIGDSLEVQDPVLRDEFLFLHLGGSPALGRHLHYACMSIQIPDKIVRDVEGSVMPDAIEDVSRGAERTVGG
ncbi:MAG: hypothetical protein Q9214_005180, partial [Letrouitia sp. 1 TL-2023]